MKNYITQFAILLVGLVITQTAYGDVKIKSRQTMSGQSTEHTTYIKGKRQRSEYNNGATQMVNLTQCDLRRNVRIMPNAQTFMIDSWQAAQNVEPTIATSQMQSVTKGGVVTTTYTIKDTGERKQMFGYTARHLITTMESVSSPDACSKDNSKMQFDGWYIDAAFVLNCENEQYINYRQNSSKGGCQDRHQVKQVGTAKRGYPVWEKTIVFDESGKESYSMLSEVLEFSNTTLDAALFEVPSGYREVKDSSELYATISSNSSTSGNSSNSYSAGNNSSGSDSGIGSAVQNLSKSSSKTKAEVGEKKAGVVRVGLAGVKTGSIGEGMNASELAGAIQNTLSEYLKSPNVELVALDAKLAQAVDAEAKQKECDFVIYANVAHKKGGGGGGMFGKMLGNIASSAVSSVGYGSSSAAGVVAGQAASQAIYTAANASENVKSKDEITLDIKVNSTGGAQALTRQFKAKAKSNGEDIISPIIEQAAQAILDAVSKK